MNVRYSDLTVQQLRTELAKCKEEAQKAEQLGEVQKVLILERKIQMLASYLLHPDDFKQGETYKIKGDPGYTFTINFLEGVMAWGHRINLLGEKEEKEVALPLALLEE